MSGKRIALAAAAAIVLAGCGERDARPEIEREQDAVPVGTEVAPPRSAPETGSLSVPGQEPDAPLIVGEEGDTVQ
jgi:hypothetical protein